VQAETRWFEVELLVFERNADVQELKEQLSSEQLFVDTQNSINILKPNKSNTCLQGQACLSEPFPTIINGAVFDSQGNNFRYLGSSSLQLTEQRRRLASHAGFNPVFHMAWRMPISGPQQSKPIHLFAGENYAFKYPFKNTSKPSSITATVDQTIDLTNTISDAAPKALSPSINLNPDKWAIDGNFKIYLNHFLYIDSQLIIRKEMTQEITQAKQVVEVINDENGVQIANQVNNTVTETQTIKKQVLKEILFDQNRRLRSEEIHYLDHPLMGIIVQIRKIP
tara:strand:- start:9256 stop:10098 length:843 start_codon:yes stop_codon:yes gene_type:complete